MESTIQKNSQYHLDLEKKYGQVNISLVDGTLTPVEEKGLAKV